MIKLPVNATPLVWSQIGRPDDCLTFWSVLKTHLLGHLNNKHSLDWSCNCKVTTCISHVLLIICRPLYCYIMALVWEKRALPCWI